MLKHIFRILKEYFPTNIAYWSDVNEAHVLKLVDSGLYKHDPNSSISKEIFYEQAKKAFSKNIIDEGIIDKAISLFRDIWTTSFDKKAFLEGRQLFISLLSSLPTQSRHVTI